MAVIVSLPCGVLAAVGRIAAANSWGFRVSWLRSALFVPFTIASDALQVLLLVFRSPGREGEFVRVPIKGGVGEGRQARGRRTRQTSA